MPGRSDRATTKIFVGNLPDRYPDDSLRELFEQYGEVSECDVIKNFAFVHFVSEAEAEAAVKGLNAAEVKGKNIRVEISEKVRQIRVAYPSVKKCGRRAALVVTSIFGLPERVNFRVVQSVSR